MKPQQNAEPVHHQQEAAALKVDYPPYLFIPPCLY